MKDARLADAVRCREDENRFTLVALTIHDSMEILALQKRMIPSRVGSPGEIYPSLHNHGAAMKITFEEECRTGAIRIRQAFGPGALFIELPCD